MYSNVDINQIHGQDIPMHQQYPLHFLDDANYHANPNTCFQHPPPYQPYIGNGLNEQQPVAMNSSNYPNEHYHHTSQRHFMELPPPSIHPHPHHPIHPPHFPVHNQGRAIFQNPNQHHLYVNPNYQASSSASNLVKNERANSSGETMKTEDYDSETEERKEISKQEAEDTSENSNESTSQTMFKIPSSQNPSNGVGVIKENVIVDDQSESRSSMHLSFETNLPINNVNLTVSEMSNSNEKISNENTTKFSSENNGFVLKKEQDLMNVKSNADINSHISDRRDTAKDKSESPAENFIHLKSEKKLFAQNSTETIEDKTISSELVDRKGLQNTANVIANILETMKQSTSTDHSSDGVLVKALNTLKDTLNNAQNDSKIKTENSMNIVKESHSDGDQDQTQCVDTDVSSTGRSFTPHDKTKADDSMCSDVASEKYLLENGRNISNYAQKILADKNIMNNIPSDLASAITAAASIANAMNVATHTPGNVVEPTNLKMTNMEILKENKILFDRNVQQALNNQFIMNMGNKPNTTNHELYPRNIESFRETNEPSFTEHSFKKPFQPPEENYFNPHDYLKMSLSEIHSDDEYTKRIKMSPRYEAREGRLDEHRRNGHSAEFHIMPEKKDIGSEEELKPTRTTKAIAEKPSSRANANSKTKVGHSIGTFDALVARGSFHINFSNMHRTKESKTTLMAINKACKIVEQIAEANAKMTLETAENNKNRSLIQQICADDKQNEVKENLSKSVDDSNDNNEMVDSKYGNCCTDLTMEKQEEDYEKPENASETQQDNEEKEVNLQKENETGGVSPPPSPAPTHLSSSPTLPTMLGNSLGGGPPTLPPNQPPSPPITSSSGSSGGSSNGDRGAGGLASLHHAIHGLHNLHSLQNLQNQMAALAGLQGGAGLGLVPPPAPSPAPHGSVSSLLHPHLHQTGETPPLGYPHYRKGNSMGGNSPASNAVAAATSAALAAAASSAVSGTGSTGATGSSPIAAAGSNGSLGNGGPSGAMPQMVLTSGQVMQGVQGAQLLIPTSQGVAVQPILTITLGQAGPIASTQTTGGLGSTLNQLHHLHPTHQTQPVQPPHHNIHSGGSAASSPLPTSSSSSTSPSSVSNPHPLLGLAAGLPPSLFHHHTHHNNNNNSSTNNNNSIRSCSPDKPKLPLSMASPVGGHEDTVPELPYRRYPSQHDFHTVSGLQARLGASHFPTHPPPPSHPSRYSPDFLDNHNQPTISQAGTNMVDGVNLDEIKEFAKAFKMRRLSLGLTQTQVGQALSITEGPAYSQSAICRFEKLDITPKSAQKIKPVLERWMEEAEARYKNGGHTLTDFMGNEPTKKRKRRTSFTPQALEILNAHFERNTHPSGAEITAMGEQLGYEREVVRIWFCNKRQALKNTVRMMAKGSGGPGSQPPTGPPPLPPQPQLN